MGAVKAGVYTALKCVLDPTMPLDSAVTEIVSVLAEEGTWVRPRYPAPTFGSTGEPSNRVCESVLNALAGAVPERAIAFSYASGLNVTMSGFDPQNGEEFVLYHFGPGGCGARAGSDGNAAFWHPMTSCRNESMEVWERRFPVRFSRFGLLPDSGGPGRFGAVSVTARSSRCSATCGSTRSRIDISGAHRGLPAAARSAERAAP